MSKLEVDAIEPQSGTTLTIGASGDTITIPSGVTLANSGTIDNLNATNLTSGTVPDARITGAYTGITNLTMSGNLTVDTDTFTVNSSTNRVGIGVSSPSVPLEILTNLSSDTQSTPETVLTLATKFSSTGTDGAAGSGSRLEFKIPDDETNPITGAAIAGLKENGDDSNAEAALAFYISQNDTTLDEAMRINSSGDVLVNTTSTYDSARLTVNAASGSFHPLTVRVGLVSDGFSGVIFRNPNGIQGSIAINSSSVSYNTTSDYRLKENVSYDFDATTRLKQLKPARFNFIEEPNKTVDGFLAHEVSSIVPEAISGEKDELQVWKEGEELPEGVSVGDNKLDENGNTIMQIQGIDQAKLVPLLVKTIQELEARITALENA